MKKESEQSVTVLIKQHKDKKGGHPHVVLEDIDDKHVSVGLTHARKKGKNSPNYAMEYDPLGGNKPSYMHRQGTVDNKKAYYNNRKGKMSAKDYDKAKEYGDKAKKKYIASIHKKK